MRWLMVSVSLLGCGGQVSPESVANDGGLDAASDVGSDAATLPHPPSKHRPAALGCKTPPLPPEPDLSHGSFGPSAKFECKSHAECTAGPNGRCIVFETSPPTEPGGSRCIYSLCNTDGDCGTGVCECGTVANGCVPGNCRVDSDCATGYCSPSFDMCTHAVTGYWCHTTADECIDDGDCDATHFLTHCEADPATARWVCPRAMCGA
ncbi:MAG: hypothetical protein ACXWUG_06020 [Polyangiales bacterium]